VEEDLGTLLFALTSEISDVRREGAEALGWLLGRLRREMETEEKRFAFKEVPQIFWLLTMVRNSLTTRDEMLPRVTASYAAAASRVLLRPEHPAYKAVYRNLTTGEMIGKKEIPLFEECMHNGEDEAKTLRVWWLRFVAKASDCDKSARILHHHKLMEICMTLAVADSTDRVAASLAVTIVCGMVRAAEETRQREKLVRKFGIIPWLLHMANSKHTTDDRL
jgi:nucleolar pre-ribosomal-associated protein 1